MSGENAKFTVKELFNVDGWVAVVTGGGTGIGLMIAQAFANNGAHVYITGRRADVLQTASETWGASLAHPHGKLIPIQADITDKASLQNLADEIAKREKHVDVLVNNAGISLNTSSVEKGDQSVQALQQELWSEDPAEWEQVYKSNVIGHFFTTVALAPLLAAAQRADHTACVINISSMSGITRTSQHHFMYNVSKAADIHLTSLLAQELRRPGVKVRVNSIAPGIFPSEMTTEDSDSKNKSQIPTGDDYGEKKGIPAGRPGREEDMAQAALFLACNQYMWGQTVAVEGGYLLEHP
ncbi:NAD(P)-binding protein [Obba rivulosa]|uniref:NAD(P)-binding protein n=1 Tax=Obba rivulosa TaxID=1052685 RepID=A0A8E2DRU3_9APHY|nr:NAD(P)-binding protein [Obba rivulosa]